MHISDLLVDIKLDIFTRLPAQDILSCRQVCKPWETLLSNPSFAGLHLQKQKQLLEQNGDGDDHKVTLDYLLLIRFKNCDQENQLWLSNYDQKSDYYKTSKMINQLNPPTKMNSIVGSSNGLICMSLSQNPFGMYDPVYICNPITREYVNLPSYTECWYGLIYSGFGYVDSTNEYKAVRIYYGEDKNVGKVQVYTLGAGTGWRNKQDFKRGLQYNPIVTRGLFLNGAIHWLDDRLNLIIFNLAEEKFYKLPSPAQPHYYDFVILAGCLCLVYHKGGLMELYLLRKKQELWKWTKEYAITVERNSSQYYPFSLTKTGEVLMWGEEGGLCLYRYNPKTANVDRLASHSIDFNYFESISHINSFVSLKAIGEDAKIISVSKEKEEMHFDDLLLEFKIEIFTRLPAQDILSCRQVCKPWETLLSDPSFVALHTWRQKLLLEQNDQKVSLDFLLLIKFKNCDQDNQLWLGKYDKDSYTTSKMINQLNPPIKMNSIVGSSNGLICMSLSQTPHGMFDPVYICNPITREYVNLPAYTNSWYGLIYSGFGYVDSTDEYKAVRIYYGQDKSVGKVQVYTLGAGTGWRNKPDVMCTFQFNTLVPRGFFLDGAIHWMDEQLNIVLFDLEDEKFYQLPPSPVQNFYCNFMVLGGCICVIEYKDGGLMELWLLKKENTEELGDEQSWRWTRDYAIAGSDSPNYCPFSLTKSGEVLMLHKEGGLRIYRYDPTTASMDCLASHSEGLSFFESIPHINSLVSLKAIGEDAKIINLA